MSKVISLDQFRQKKSREQEESTIAGTLIWLRCPTCKTFEYTEVIAPYGRTHKCGTLVEEAPVEIDLRAEVTIAKINLRLIEEMKNKSSQSKWTQLFSKPLEHVLESFQRAEKTYLKRLDLAAGKPVTPYPNTREDLLLKLPIAATNQLGFIISHFRFEPEKRFESSKNSK